MSRARWKPLWKVRLSAVVGLLVLVACAEDASPPADVEGRRGAAFTVVTVEIG